MHNNGMWQLVSVWLAKLKQILTGVNELTSPWIDE